MRWSRRLVTALVLLAVVIGPPAAAVLWIRASYPHWPTGAQVRGWIADPLTDQAVLVGVAGIATLLWAVVAALVLADTARRVRAGVRRMRRLPLPTPAQATASSMAGVAAFGIPAAAVAGAPVDTGPGPTTHALEHRPGDLLPAAEQPDGDPPAADADGVGLRDGGWVPWHTAQAAASAAGILWLRRRRSYRPRPAAGRRADDDGAAVPATVAALQSAAATRPQQAPTAVDGELTALDQIPAGGLALAGPGAADAARGLLVTALLQPAANQHQRIITTRADLAVLMGTATIADLHNLAGLIVADSIDVALASFDGDYGDRATRDQSTTGAQGSPTLLLAHAPAHSPAHDRITACLATRPGSRFVIVGVWPHGAIWDVGADGCVTSPDSNARPRRLCVLGRRAAADLIRLAAAAYGPADAAPTAGGPTTSQVDARPARLPSASPTTAEASPAVAGTAAWQLTLLGPVELRHHGGPVVVRRSAALQVLAVLAVYADGATTSELADAIWPDLHPHAVSHRLHTTISELRKVLHAVSGDTVVVRDDDTYRLDPRSIGVDLWRLRGAVSATAAAVGSAEHHAALRTVIDLGHAAVAAGKSWPWLAGPRETVRRDVLDAYLGLIDTRPPAETIDLLREALRFDPLNEDLALRTMKTLAATGDLAAVTATRDAHLRRLRHAGLPTATEVIDLADQLAAIPHDQR